VSAAPELVVTRPRPGNRSLLTALLVTAFAASALTVAGDDLLRSGGGHATRAVLASLLRPDLSPSFLLTVADATALTAAYAVAGTSVALLIGLPGALFLSGVVHRRRWTRAVSVLSGRATFATLRAVHELVWALLLVSVLGLTPLTGILAIGIPYGATIARVLGDQLVDVPDEPTAALTAAGASPWQVLVYGRLPLAGTALSGYLFYRLECAVRAAAVLSFVGLGGIGYRVEVALADLRFEQVWPLLAALLLLVLTVDRVSRAVRERVAG
jgi:phosphonate transport system permease protein